MEFALDWSSSTPVSEHCACYGFGCGFALLHVLPRLNNAPSFVTSPHRAKFAPADYAYPMNFSKRRRFASSAHMST